MKKEVYEIQKFEVEIPYSKREEIKSGIGLDCIDPVTEKRFDSLDEAKKELAKYKPSAQILKSGGSKYIFVKEYAVAIFTVDEEDEFVSGTDYDWVEDFQWNEEEQDIR